MAAINIVILGDPKQFERAGDKIEEALRDVESEARKSGKAIEGVGKELDKLGDGNPAGKLGKDFAGLADDLDGSGRRAGKRFGSGLADGVDREASGIGSKLSGKLGGIGLAGVGAGLAAGLLAGFQDVLDRRAGSALLDAQLGLSGQMAGAASDVAKELFKLSPAQNMEEAQAAVVALTQQVGGLGAVSKDAFLEWASQAIGVSKVMGEDVSTVIRSAQNLVRNGLAKNIPEALDLITAASQRGGNRAGDLLDTIDEYSVQWAKLGISGPQAMGMLVNGLQGGARDTDKLADAMKEFSIRAIDGSVLTRDAYRSLGLDAQKLEQDIAKGGPAAQTAMGTILTALAGIKDPVEQNRIGVALFGTQWEDLGPQAVLGMNPAIGAMQGFEGAAAKATDTQKLTGWQKAWETNIAQPVSEFLDEAATAAEKNGGRGLAVYLFGENNVADFERGFEDLKRGWEEVTDAASWFKDHVLDPIIGTLQTAFNMARDFANNPVFKAVFGDGPANIGNAANGLRELLGFDAGGVVPGPRGAPTLALVHGGETILPTHKTTRGVSTSLPAAPSGVVTLQPVIVMLDGREVGRAAARRVIEMQGML